MKLIYLNKQWCYNIAKWGINVDDKVKDAIDYANSNSSIEDMEPQKMK